MLPSRRPSDLKTDAEHLEMGLAASPETKQSRGWLDGMRRRVRGKTRSPRSGATRSGSKEASNVTPLPGSVSIGDELAELESGAHSAFEMETTRMRLAPKPGHVWVVAEASTTAVVMLGRVVELGEEALVFGEKAVNIDSVGRSYFCEMIPADKEKSYRQAKFADMRSVLGDEADGSAEQIRSEFRMAIIEAFNEVPQLRGPTAAEVRGEFEPMLRRVIPQLLEEATPVLAKATAVAILDEEVALAGVDPSINEPERGGGDLRNIAEAAANEARCDLDPVSPLSDDDEDSRKCFDTRVRAALVEPLREFKDQFESLNGALEQILRRDLQQEVRAVVSEALSDLPRQLRGPARESSQTPRNDVAKVLAECRVLRADMASIHSLLRSPPEPLKPLGLAETVSRLSTADSASGFGPLSPRERSQLRPSGRSPHESAAYDSAPSTDSRGWPEEWPGRSARPAEDSPFAVAADGLRYTEEYRVGVAHLESGPFRSAAESCAN